MSIASTLSSRKMSGLGIDFHSFERSPSEAGQLWEDTAIYAIHSAAPSLHHISPVQQQRKMSRWSESTRASHPVTASSVSDMGHSGLHSTASSVRRSSRCSPGPSKLSVPTAQHKDPGPSGSHGPPRGRGSDDSQASSGPATPVDENSVASFAIPLPEETSNYLAASRRAPLPPVNGTPPVPAGQRSLERRPSFSQSMMRTLTGRKSAITIPAPLELVPAVPPLPANLDLAPIVHHVTLPVNIRKDSRGNRLSNSPSPTKNATFRTTNEQPRRESANKTPRGSFSSIIRSIRKSISSESRKSSAASTASIPAHLVVPVTHASPITRQKAPSPIISSPSMRSARAIHGLASKSYDFGYSSGPKAKAGQQSPVIPRPLTAPAHTLSFPKNIQQTSSATASTVGRSVGSESPLPDLGQPVDNSLFDKQYNPWATYVPAASYISAIPISPAEAGLKASLSGTRRPSRTDASLYKQSVLDSGRNEGAHLSQLVTAPAIRTSYASSGPPPTIDLPPTPGVEGNQSSTYFEKSTNTAITRSGLPALDHRTSFLSLTSSVGECSIMLSPSMPEPAPRKGSRSKSVDQQAEQQMAPHLYLETLGAMSLRNPFAATENGPRRASGPQEQRKPSLVSKANAEVGEKVNDKASGYTRKVSFAEESAGSVEGGEDSRGMVVTTDWTPSLQAQSHDELKRANQVTPLDLFTPATEKSLDLVEELLGSPMPTFKNPFFTKTAIFAAVQPSPTTRSSQSDSPGRRPSFLADPFDTPYGRSSICHRKASVADTSSRRPSIASAASSSFGYPSKPNKLEARRLTDFATRGIRVSIDSEIY